MADINELPPGSNGLSEYRAESGDMPLAEGEVDVSTAADPRLKAGTAIVSSSLLNVIEPSRPNPLPRMNEKVMRKISEWLDLRR